jgi:hypothetical protein
VRTTLRWPALLLLVTSTACGGDGGGAAEGGFSGTWTSRPKQHSESKEAVELFGESNVQRLHDLGNSLTPPIRLELRADGRFEAVGRLTPTGDDGGKARGRWEGRGSSVRLSVESVEGAPGLARTLVLPAEGLALTWGASSPRPAAPPSGGADDDSDVEDADADDEVYLFRE